MLDHGAPKGAEPENAIPENAVQVYSVEEEAGKLRGESAEAAADTGEWKDMSLGTGKKAEVVHGFELVRKEDVRELGGTASIYRHLKTGAQILSIECADDNKCFAASFRTPPADSTGLPHILEHCVLEGSEKYPLKDLFKALSKSSLKTFLNASTSSDQTYYPCASQNLKDFYNLSTVYLDAVFHPKLTEETFKQEGWHFEIADPADPLKYKGVVYNEMKGANSSPGRLLFVHCKHSLFPDTPYVHDSGGDPREIPKLTYADFKAFHAAHYHPSNAKLFFYGNDPVDERLRIVDEAIRDFDAQSPSAEIPLQPPFAQPISSTHPYPVSSQGGDAGKSYVTVNWALPPCESVEDSLALYVLDDILIGRSSSPLRKALLASGLGDGLASYGLHSGQRQPWFSTGLKGANSADAGKIEKLVFDTLEELARSGISKETIEASVNSIEFGLRECDTGSQPRGLEYMGRAMREWLYERDPIEALRYEAALDSLKSRLSAGERIFEDLIRQRFLGNPHRSRVVLEPDSGMQEREDKAETEALERVKSSMDAARIAEAISASKALKEYQEIPDTPEVRATLPRLEIGDLDRAQKYLASGTSQLEGAQIYRQNLATNGINYLKVTFDLKRLPEDLLPLAPLFTGCLLRMDKERLDYVKFNEQIGIHTGGIGADLECWVHRQTGETGAAMMLKGKALAGKSAELCQLAGEMLMTVKLDNQERFLEMVKERRSRLEDRLIPDGNSFALGRLAAQTSPASAAEEAFGGIDQLYFLRALQERVRNDWPGVLQDLEKVRECLVSRDGLSCNVTSDEAGWQALQQPLDKLLRDLPSKSAPVQAWSAAMARDEGFTVPARVNYVALGGNLFDQGYQFHGSALVAREILASAWLWDQIRVKGGAYGAGVSIDRTTGAIAFTSYRDPNLERTLDVFKRSGEFLRTAEISPEDLRQAIIGAIGKLEPCLLPGAEGALSYRRNLRGITHESLQQTRDEVLNTTVDDIRSFAGYLDSTKDKMNTVVIGGEEALKKAAGLGLSIRSLN